MKTYVLPANFFEKILDSFMDPSDDSSAGVNITPADLGGVVSLSNGSRAYIAHVSDSGKTIIIEQDGHTWPVYPTGKSMSQNYPDVVPTLSDNEDYGDINDAGEKPLGYVNIYRREDGGYKLGKLRHSLPEATEMITGPGYQKTIPIF
jgi:hypothetical protein